MPAAWAVPPRTEPLLFIGKADAELSGAVAYDFLKSPLDYPRENGEARFRANLPVDFSARAHEYLQDINDSLLVVPEFLASVFQRLNAHLEASAPLGRTTVFFAARENAGFEVSGGLGNTRFLLDTTLEESGSLLLKGSVHLPLHLDMNWRSLSFGFAFAASPALRLGFQLHKHLFAARLAGDLKPDLVGRMEIAGEGSNASAVVEFPEDRVFGLASGRYKGEAWSPEAALQLGPLYLVSRMGAQVRARGSFHVDYSVPFFIDPVTFEPKFTEPDSFLAPENLRRFLDSEVERNGLRLEADLLLNLPQSHTAALVLWNGRFSLGYTRVLGSLYFRHDPQQAGETQELQGLDAAIHPDHVVMVSLRLARFRLNTGAHTFNIDYGGRKNLLSGLFPLEVDGNPLVPVLHLGCDWGLWPRLSLDMHLLPLPALRMGMSHAF